MDTPPLLVQVPHCCFLMQNKAFSCLICLKVNTSVTVFSEEAKEYTLIVVILACKFMPDIIRGFCRCHKVGDIIMNRSKDGIENELSCRIQKIYAGFGCAVADDEEELVRSGSGHDSVPST